MNWDMLGAIGELAGAIAVVATLVYLARQVRDGSRQDRRNQSVQLQRDIASAIQPLSVDAELCDVWLRGLRDQDSLDEVEKLRFGTVIFNLSRAQEAAFHFHREGGVHEFHWTVMEDAMKDILVTPGVRAWWAHRRGWFSEEYRAAVDGWIEEDVTGFLARYDTADVNEPQD